MAHKLHEMLEKIEKVMSEQIEKGTESVDTEEFGKVADIYKDLMCAKKDYYEAKYYCSLVYAMEEADTEDIMDMFDRYNDNGENRRYYDRYRYKNGRFAPKGKGRRMYEEKHMPLDMDMYRNYSDEELRDMDRVHYGRMYYGGDSNGQTNAGSKTMRDSREGRSGMSRRNYMETKQNHGTESQIDKEKQLHAMSKYIDDEIEDMRELLPSMIPESKTTLKTKLQNFLNTI